MHPLAGRRGKAYLLDCLGYVGVGAAMAPLGVWAHRRGLIGRRQLPVHLVSAVLPVVATVWAARQESGRGATWGKRRYRLVVSTEDGTAMPFGTALLRNTVKILIPWQLGHTATIGAVHGGVERGEPLTLAANVTVYPLVAAMISTVVAGSGRGLHDRVAGSVVHGPADRGPATARERSR